MRTIFRYLRKQKAEIGSKVNALDAMVFAWLSYFNYPENLTQKETFCLNQLTLRQIKDKTFWKDASNPGASRKLMKRIYDSPRFGTLGLSDFCERKSEEEVLQFAALTIHLSSHLHLVSFRGTDPSFVGWEEDFLMSLEKPTASQICAAEYLKNAMEKYSGSFLLFGHSKGGNLALYSSLQSDEQERIVQVYSFDNPGFLLSFEQEKIHSLKVARFVPQSSVIGMFFGQPFPAMVVKSYVPFLFQHDMFSWKVKKDSFALLPHRTKLSYRLDEAFNGWVDSLTIEERKKFTHLLFGMLKDSKAEDFLSLVFGLPVYGTKIYRIYKSMDPVDRFFLKKTIQRLVKEYQATKTLPLGDTGRKR